MQDSLSPPLGGESSLRRWLLTGAESGESALSLGVSAVGGAGGTGGARFEEDGQAQEPITCEVQTVDAL